MVAVSSEIVAAMQPIYLDIGEAKATIYSASVESYYLKAVPSAGPIYSGQRHQ